MKKKRTQFCKKRPAKSKSSIQPKTGIRSTNENTIEKERGSLDTIGNAGGPGSTRRRSSEHYLLGADEKVETRRVAEKRDEGNHRSLDLVKKEKSRVFRW